MGEECKRGGNSAPEPGEAKGVFVIEWLEPRANHFLPSSKGGSAKLPSFLSLCPCGAFPKDSAVHHWMGLGENKLNNQGIPGANFLGRLLS